jgi:hypothetical protein
LDYYAIDRLGSRAAGILIEEFRFDEDRAAVRLSGTMWTVADHQWSSSRGFSRAIRADAITRARVSAVEREEAEALFARLGGGDLPAEAALHGRFGAGEPFASPQLRLTAGVSGIRVYRLLFANEPRSVAELTAIWSLRYTGDTRIAGTAERCIGPDAFRWDLRRIGPGVAWCVDLTVHLGGPDDCAIGPLLRELTGVMRGQGLIPVTIERFS